MSNYTDHITKFKEKEVYTLWADFVYQEYEKKMPDEDITRGDR